MDVLDELRETRKFNTDRWGIDPKTGKVDTLQKIKLDSTNIEGSTKYKTDTLETRKFLEILQKVNAPEEPKEKLDAFMSVFKLNGALTQLFLNLKRLLGSK